MSMMECSASAKDEANLHRTHTVDAFEQTDTNGQTSRVNEGRHVYILRSVGRNARGKVASLMTDRACDGHGFI